MRTVRSLCFHILVAGVAFDGPGLILASFLAKSSSINAACQSIRYPYSGRWYSSSCPAFSLFSMSCEAGRPNSACFRR